MRAPEFTDRELKIAAKMIAALRSAKPDERANVLTIVAKSFIEPVPHKMLYGD